MTLRNRVKSRIAGRRINQTLSGAFERKSKIESATVAGRNLIRINGRLHRASGVDAADRGAEIDVINAGRPSAAIYVPATQRASIGRIGKSTTVITTTTSAPTTADASAFVTQSAGAADAGKGILLDGGGQVDASMINPADLDHQNLTGAGSNDHAAIDGHLAATNNPHAVTAAQAGAADLAHNHDGAYTPLAHATDTNNPHAVTAAQAGAADAAHNHHSDYYQKTEHIATSAGAADAGKPVKTDAAGQLDSSLIPGGGGGGSDPVLVLSGFNHGAPSTISTSAYAAKGTSIQPDRDMTIHALAFVGDAVTGATYKAQIVTYSGGTIDTVIAESPIVTVGGTQGDRGKVWMVFSEPVSLTAGTVYACLTMRTDAGDTHALPQNSESLARTPFDTRIDRIAARVAKASPAAGDAIDITTLSTPFILGFAWSYPDVTLSGSDLYALLAGKAGGQTIPGDTAAGGKLTLKGTAHATAGPVLINPGETAAGLGILEPDPQGALHIHDGKTGKLITTKSGVSDTSVIVIPGGPRDVKRMLKYETITLNEGGSDVQHATGTIVPTGSATIWSDGGTNTARIVCGADGTVSVRRYTGTAHTYEISLELFWK